MLTTQSGELAKKMIELEGKAHELAGGPFNLGSPKQLQQILFEQQDKLVKIIQEIPFEGIDTQQDAVNAFGEDLTDYVHEPRL